MNIFSEVKSKFMQEAKRAREEGEKRKKDRRYKDRRHRRVWPPNLKNRLLLIWKKIFFNFMLIIKINYFFFFGLFPFFLMMNLSG